MTEKKPSVLEQLAPWLGLAGAAVGWFVSHQVGSNAALDDCREAGPAFVLLVGLAGLLIAGGGGFFSWRVWRRGEGESEGRRFVGLVGLLLAGFAVFAILLQSVAALILPRCLA